MLSVNHNLLIAEVVGYELDSQGSCRFVAL
jgi:hypothetical protein